MNTVMPSHPDPSTSAPTNAQPRLKRVLSLPQLVVFGLTYLAPVVVFTTYGIVTAITQGHLAAAYLLALIVMLLTALSYGHLSRELPKAGSAYTYVRSVFGPVTGFITGWALMIDYLLLPMLNYLVMGIMVNAQFPAIPVWAVIIVGILIVHFISVIGVRTVTGVSLGILLVSILLILVFVGLSISKVLTQGVPETGALFPIVPGSEWLVVLTGASILTTSFLGFDAVTTLSEEARNPRRDIPRAVLLTAFIAGLLFIGTSWVAQLVHPDWTSFGDIEAAGSELMFQVGGSVLMGLFTAIYSIACLGAALAAQVSVSRVLYAMGRDRVLPAVFARVSPRFSTPTVAITCVSLLALIAIAMSLSLGFELVSFGALSAFAMVNLVVIVHFFVKKRERSVRGILIYCVLPGLGVAANIWLWVNLGPLALIVGSVWTLLGVLFLAVKSRGFRKEIAIDFSESDPDLANSTPEQESGA
ncbi:MAG: APC family permease [Actinobacteria bacterium]|nr:APC family permease [Actinomycetota bacterium]